MRRQTMRGRACAILAIAAVLASLALAACGTTAKKKGATGGSASGGSTCTSSGGTTATQPQPLTLNIAKVASVAKQVPTALQGKTLTVASDASYAPNEFKPVGK